MSYESFAALGERRAGNSDDAAWQAIAAETREVLNFSESDYHLSEIH